ncbi:MAG: GtrA family protein [Atopobiaceae bacterium]|nr:GtrA family protein [Atopobiaceae bacterium]
MSRPKRMDIRTLARKARSGISNPRFLRFMSASASCSVLDQLLAGVLFSLLRNAFPDTNFLRILIANVTARVFSLSLNYTLNRRLVFSLDVEDAEWQRNSRRESLPRFIALSAGILALSTLGVFVAHALFGVAEWKAKIAIDIALFFLNYNVQRKWVFRNEVTISPKKVRRR